jgi:hypothetical protein
MHWAATAETHRVRPQETALLRKALRAALMQAAPARRAPMVGQALTTLGRHHAGGG